MKILSICVCCASFCLLTSLEYFLIKNSYFRDVQETKELEKAKNRLAKLQQEKLALEKLKQTKLDPDGKIKKQDEVLQTVQKWSKEGKISRYISFFLKCHHTYVCNYFHRFFLSLEITVFYSRNIVHTVVMVIS